MYQLGLGILLALLLMAGQALAESLSICTYTIPFTFYAGTVKLPAGQHIVKIPSWTKGLVFLESMNGAERAILLTIPFGQKKDRAPSKLVFNRYGKTFFLSRVWDNFSNKGQEVMKSKAEKEYIVQQTGVPQTIEAARLHR